MRIGQYMTPLLVERPTGPVGPTGHRNPRAWEIVGTIYAFALRQISSERDLGDRIVPMVRTTWRTHYRPDVDASMRLRDGSRIWRIENVVDIEHRHAELEITAVEEVTVAA